MFGELFECLNYVFDTVIKHYLCCFSLHLAVSNAEQEATFFFSLLADAKPAIRLYCRFDSTPSQPKPAGKQPNSTTCCLTMTLYRLYEHIQH